ncbi:MAG: rRNA pseudouridine synthase [Holosporaceae bacterium]|jgi:23S rRNA pseudouridine2605 synthase|nr:rRNA pseudouridine synthase [Holosporaceae bacterium]
MRLAKRIAESGVASRREAERLIEAGRVAVDGKIATTPVFFVEDQSEISVDGKILAPKSEKIIIWKFHKPRGVISTKSDPQKRKTVFDFFPKTERRLIYVGRLDYNSEGLLLFTNNGDIARKLELPSAGLKRIYRAKVFGRLTDEKIRELEKGATVDGIRYRPAIIKRDNLAVGKANSWITATLFEGKNREIRKMMESVGCVVNRLIRISYGQFNLDDLPPGGISQVSEGEIKKLLRKLAGESTKPKLSKL